jgi:DNA-binding beta-propeller fold protein YncE
MHTRHVVALLCLALPIAGPARAQTSGYHVAKRIAVGGEGGWDYLTVDAAARRLYVSHATHVVVVDLAGDTVVGDIANTPGVHGIAIAPDLGRGFVSSGRDSSVTIFDLRTLAVISRVNVGARNPDAIVYEPVSHRVFTMNGGTANATAVDAATGATVGMVALNGRPEFAVADGQGKIFLNLEDSSAVVALDARTLQVTGRWPLAPCEEPSGLAMDREHRRLFSVCSNRMMAVLDANTGRVITTLPTGGGTDGAAFDPGTGLAFSSNGEGTLTVVREESPDRFTVLDNVQTQRSARTVGLDERTHRLYLSAAELGPAPAPTPQQPRPRPPIVPGSFVVLVVDR